MKTAHLITFLAFLFFFFLAHLSVLPEQSIVGELIVWFG